MYDIIMYLNSFVLLDDTPCNTKKSSHFYLIFFLIILQVCIFVIYEVCTYTGANIGTLEMIAKVMGQKAIQL